MSPTHSLPPHQSSKDNNPLRSNLNIPVIDLSDEDVMKKDMVTVNQPLTLKTRVVVDDSLANGK